MLFGRKKYYFSYLSAVTAFVTVFYLVFAPVFLGFNSNFISKVEAASVTWVGGVSGNWETGANWSTGVPPTAADDVTISSSTANIAVTLTSGQTADFNSLTIGGDSTYYATTTFTGNIGTGGAITVNTKGVLEQNNVVNQTITGDLVIASGGKLTHATTTPDSTIRDKAVLFTVPNFNLQAGGLVDLIGKGFSKASCTLTTGTGPAAGVAGGSSASGGGHGGLGGQGGGSTPSATKYAYDDMAAPTQPGSSGGPNSAICAGSGGGVINLTIAGGGTATISGTVSSTGANGATNGFGRFSGAGAGGSVWVNFSSGGTFTGSGTIGALGGGATGFSAGVADEGGGAGGGGRIAITGQSTDTFTGTFAYSGGKNVNGPLAQDGGAGTLYKKLNSATYGDLYVDNNGSTDSVATYSSSTATIANLWLNNRANFVVSSSTVLTITSTTLGIATVSSTLNIDGTLITPSSFVVTGRNQVLATAAQLPNLTDLTIAANGLLEIDGVASSSAWSLNSISVSGELTSRHNTSTISNTLSLSASTITVNSGGLLSVDRKGYAGGNGYFTGGSSEIPHDGYGPGGGQTGETWGGGGAYGGAGGFGQDYDGDNNPAGRGGTAYGSTSTPEYEAGSGGGGGARYVTDNGGAGGGIIKIVATTLTINGTLSANGGQGNACGSPGGSAGGGGAGGGIKIQVTTLAGNGLLRADGGRGGFSVTCEGGGGGGGGRILVVATESTFSGSASSAAGPAGNIPPLAEGENGVAGSYTIAPTVPHTLYSNAISAQAGTTNPTLLATTTPFFSAIFTDLEAGDTATKAHIQVSTSSVFSTITHWDSDSSGTAITTCTLNARCQDLKYGYFGTAPTTNLVLNDDVDENSQTLYYWRLRYFDAQGGPGSYSSTTATFTLLDAPNEPSAAAVSSITATSAAITWTDNSAIEDNYVVEVATDGSDTFTAVSTTSANATSATTSTLSSNSQYQYRVKGTNAAGSSYYSTSSLFYTLAAVAPKPTTTVHTATSLLITIDPGDNSTTTLFAVYNDTASQYVAADGTLTSTPIYQTTTTWGVDFANTGLTPNTLYKYSVIARNNDGIDSATSPLSDGTYTFANVPTTVTGASTAGSRSATISWSTNGNPAGTVYTVDGLGNGLSSGNITATSFQFTGLVAGGTYIFRVRASNATGFASAYSSSVSVTITADDGSPAPAGGDDAPEPPKPEDDPFDDPVDPDFMPTGLIKIVSRLSGEVDFLQEAGVSTPYKVNAPYGAKTAPGTSELSKLQKPFTLNFSFDVQAQPKDVAGEKLALFAKGSDYYFGFNGLPNSPSIKNDGFCFITNNGFNKVCDDIFDRGAFALDKRYDYSVIWNGDTLNLMEGNKLLSMQKTSSIISSDAPVVVGGAEYKVDTRTFYTSYPTTIYKMQLKSEPVLTHTNKTEVKLKIDASYAPDLALKESDTAPSTNFGDVGYTPINSEVLWTLTGADGKKCINARFRSAQKKFTYDTYACAILDRIKPPATFLVTTGFNSSGVKVSNAKISGSTEAEAAVTIFFERFYDTSGASAEEGHGINEPAAWLAVAGSADARLAASLKTQFSVKANKDGTWQYPFSNTLDSNARYVIAVQTRDLAGNVSDLETQDFVANPKPKPCDPTKNDCPKPPCDPTKEKCDEPPCDPTKEDCAEPPCDPLTSKCDDEPAKPDNEPDNKPDNNKPDNSNPNNSGDSSGSGSGSSNNGSGGGVSSSTIPSVNEDGFFNTVINSLVNTYNQARALINDPRIQAFNKKIAVPLAAALAMANAAVAFQLPYLINLFRYLFSQPYMWWHRRKQKSWGVVYNSYTKEPVDLATIRLVDVVTGRTMASQVTDFHGRYFMSANQGQFRLEVVKPGFAGFSEFLKEKDEDTKFANLYHGAAFYPPHDQFEINYNIPLDPIVENKPLGKILRDNLWEKINYGLSFAGMAASLMSFVVTPSWYTFGFVCLHVGLFTIFYRFAHHKLPPVWGAVRELGTKSPVGRVVVRVFDSAYNKLVNTAVTDSTGRYAILVGPSTYYLSYEKPGYIKKLSPTLDYSSKKTDGMGGIINRDEMLEKIKPGSVLVDPDPQIEPVKPVVSEGSVTEKEAPKSDIDKVQDDINNWKKSNY